MKTLMIAMLMAGAAVYGQETVSITNNAGKVYRGTVTRVAADGIVFRDGNAMTVIKFRDLPQEARERYGYDPAKASQADEKRKAEAEARARRDTESKAMLADRMKLNGIEQSKMYISATVVQVLKDGLFLDCDMKGMKQGYLKGGGPFPGGGPLADLTSQDGVQGYVGMAFLAKKGGLSNIADGERLTAYVYPNGFFSYTSTTGAGKRIRKFTTDIRAVENPLDAQGRSLLRQSSMQAARELLR